MKIQNVQRYWDEPDPEYVQKNFTSSKPFFEFIFIDFKHLSRVEERKP